MPVVELLVEADHVEVTADKVSRLGEGRDGRGRLVAVPAFAFLLGRERRFAMGIVAELLPDLLNSQKS